MKNILITGKNSYIGSFFENYIKENFSDDYAIDTVDMLDGTWRDKDFSKYDAVFHVAGIAHADVNNVSDDTKSLYYKINTELAIETAEKAMTDGAKQFIFMSSAIVYGESAPIGKLKIITKDTTPAPTNFYGDSKLRAEQGILPFQSDAFNVVVLRAPMIYGKGSKGNYPVLSKLARKLPFFPNVSNTRSMLYVENLCEFVRLIIENDEQGIFHPQNAEYSNTAEIVKMIAKAHGKKIAIIGGFTWILKLLGYFTQLVNKAFGSLNYDMSLNDYKDNYRICSLQESIERTEFNG